MKRSGPMRRVPIRRSVKRMPSRSQRRIEEADAREGIRALALHRAAFACEAEKLVPSVRCAGPLDVDEICPRSAAPGGHLDPENVQVLCRAHHDWKHANPNAAHALGLRQWSWEYEPPTKENPMDPNTAYARMLAALTTLETQRPSDDNRSPYQSPYDDEDVEELVETVATLNDWLRRQGALPDAWMR